MFVITMMGKSHLLLGSAGYLAVGVPILEASGHQTTLVEIGAGTIVAAGAAMLPDLDHPQATVARSLGPVTEILSKFVAKIAGGHRNGTHSFLACALMFIGCTALFNADFGKWAALAFVFLTTSLVMRTLTEADGWSGAIVSGIVAASIVTIAPGSAWLVDAIVLGYCLHLLGDVLTPEGIPPLWPVSKHRVKFPIIGTTGDKREAFIGVLCAIATVWLIATVVFIPAWKQQDAVAATKTASAASSRSSKNSVTSLSALKVPSTRCENRYMRIGLKNLSGATNSASWKSSYLVSNGYAKAADRRLIKKQRISKRHDRGIWKHCIKS